jgi:outer membrane protein assembly factor BamB
MKFLQKKTLKSLSVLSLLAIMIISLVSLLTLPTVNAHTPPWKVPTYSYIAATPDPVGVGQQILIVYWTSFAPPTATGSTGYTWQNLKVEVTKPDGTTQSLGPFSSDPVGGGYVPYTPDQVGMYSFTFKLPEQVLTLYNPQTGAAGQDSPYINDTYLASSATTSIKVQQDPVPEPRTYPLPEEYWTRPIEGQNTNWVQLGSHWLGGAQLGGYYDLWQKDGIAPNSPHVMWTKPIEFGGVVGGTTGVQDTGFYSGGAYEGRMVNAMIISGYLYLQLPLNHADGQRASGAGYTCINLQTGEEKWTSKQIGVPYIGVFDTNSRPTIKGQLFNYESMNQHGVVGGTIWEVRGTTWIAYDAYTGEWIYNLTNVPSGFEIYTKAGEIVRYVLNYNTNSRSGWLALWNNTAEHQGLHGGLGSDTNGYQWRPMGKTVDMSKAYTWNVSISADLVGNSAPTIVRVLPGDIIIGRSSTFARTGGTPNPYTLWAISDKPESRGQLLWKKSYDAPAANVSRQLPDGVPVDTINRIIFMSDSETMQWLGYSIDTGVQVWGPVGTSTPPYQFYGGGFGGGQEGFTAYGNIYTQSYGGDIQCFDGKDGALKWVFNDTQSGTETPWGLRPLFISAIADGKVYAFNNEHSPNYPLYKGQQVYCINATTGEEIWKILSWSGQIGGAGTSSAVLADGYLAYYNYYDNSIFCIGKGPSETTIDAPMTAVPEGSSLVIRGAVIDTAAGTKQTEQTARFPQGVPAVSDQSMSNWMEYVYMQKPRPTNATGVPVSIDVIDANNNLRNIGSTTTNADGMYSMQWKPDIPGKYTVIATFSGSESYWPSHAQTAFAVDEATATSTPQPLEAAPPTEMYFAISTTAIIIAIVIATALMMLRKRP